MARNFPAGTRPAKTHKRKEKTAEERAQCAQRRKEMINKYARDYRKRKHNKKIRVLLDRQLDTKPQPTDDVDAMHLEPQTSESESNEPPEDFDAQTEELGSGYGPGYQGLSFVELLDANQEAVYCDVAWRRPAHF